MLRTSEIKMKTDRCSRFCADACTNGHCPKALYEENPEFGEDTTCEKCYHNTGECSDCIFEHSDVCVKNEKNNNFVIRGTDIV